MPHAGDSHEPASVKLTSTQSTIDEKYGGTIETSLCYHVWSSKKL